MTDPDASGGGAHHAPGLRRARTPVTLTLASASAGRREVLRRAGIEPQIMVSHVDEDAVVAAAGAALAPAEVALLLARAKCEAVAADRAAAGTLVLGCDSVFELDGIVYGKPDGAAQARQRWRTMSGRTGCLHTGHWLIDRRAGAEGIDGGRMGAAGEAVTTKVSFARVTPTEIDAYVATGEPLACAGAFTIDGYGGAFVTGVTGDHLNVIGLSLSALRGLVARIGVGWPALWTFPAPAASAN